MTAGTRVRAYFMLSSLLCLSVTVTPGYFCCRGTYSFSLSFLLSVSVSLLLCQNPSLCLLSVFLTLSHIASLSVQLLVLFLVQLCLSVCECACSVCVLRARWTDCERVCLMLPIQTGVGQLESCGFSYASQMVFVGRDLKTSRPGCGQPGFLIMLEAAL